VRRPILTIGLTLVVSLNVLGTGGALAAPSATYVTGEQIVQTAMQYLGYPYTTVGNSPSEGFSCIGFVSYVYQSNGIPLPDNLWSAMAYAPAVPFDDLQPGDVLFFQNTVWPGLSHTGIYIGGGRFVNAEWYNRGVVVSSFTGDPIDGDYWEAHYLGANRPWGAVASAQPSAPSASPTQSTTTNQAPVQEAAPVLRQGPRATVGVAGLNVRARPSLNGAIRSVADRGARVVLLKRYHSWDWVQLKSGRFGWVYDAGLAGQGVHRAAAPLAVANLPVTRVTVGGLRVHARPNILAPIITVAYRRERVHLLRSFHNWTRILLPNGARGWVVDSYLAGMASAQGATSGAGFKRASSLSATRFTATAFDAHLTAGVRVHARPGLRAPVLGLAAYGTNIQVLREVGNWVRVRFRSGRVGYVDALYVRR